MDLFFFAGSNKPFIIEGEVLKKANAELLIQIINDADIKNISLNNRSANAKSYTIAIEENDKLSTLHFSDTADNVLIKNLVRYFKRKQKEETR